MLSNPQVKIKNILRLEANSYRLISPCVAALTFDISDRNLEGEILVAGLSSALGVRLGSESIHRLLLCTDESVPKGACSGSHHYGGTPAVQCFQRSSFGLVGQ